jgi:hypothetical protein
MGYPQIIIQVIRPWWLGDLLGIPLVDAPEELEDQKIISILLK